MFLKGEGIIRPVRFLPFLDARPQTVWYCGFSPIHICVLFEGDVEITQQMPLFGVSIFFQSTYYGKIRRYLHMRGPFKYGIFETLEWLLRVAAYSPAGAVKTAASPQIPAQYPLSRNQYR